MKKESPIVTRAELILLAFLLVALFALSFAAAPRPTFSSTEVKFTDASAHGLEVVPASCPSFPHYSGNCSAHSCTPSVSCLNSSTVHSVSASCSVQDVTCPQYWSCGAGACVPPPPASFVAFSAKAPDGSALAATGHLQARPALVVPGGTARLYWNVQNALSCSVVGGGDTWTSTASGDSGVVTSPITAQTIYTLHCNSYPGATPAFVEESQTVNVVPTFHEL